MWYVNAVAMPAVGHCMGHVMAPELVCPKFSLIEARYRRHCGTESVTVSQSVTPFKQSMTTTVQCAFLTGT